MAAAVVQQTLTVNALKNKLMALELEGPLRGNTTTAGMATSPHAVAAMDARLTSLETSMSDLQAADQQNLELQRLMVNDISALKATVTQAATADTASSPQLSAQVDPRVNDLEKKVDELSTLVLQDAAFLKEAITNLSLDLDDSVEQIQSNLETRIEAVTQQRVRDVYERVAQLATKVASVEERGEATAAQAQAVGAAVEALGGTVGRVAAESQALSAQVGAVAAQTAARTTALASKVDRAEQAAASRAAAVSGAVTELAGKVGTAEARVAAVTGQVEATVGAVESRATERVEVLATQVARMAGDTTRLEQRAASAATEATAAAAAAKSVKVDADRRFEDMAQQLAAVDASLEARAEAVATRVSTWSRVSRAVGGVARGAAGAVRRPVDGVRGFLEKRRRDRPGPDRRTPSGFINDEEYS